MSVQVDYFSTSKFIIKADNVDRFKELIELLKEEGNTGCGYYSSEHYMNLYEYGNNSFSIHTGGYCDGGPELKDSIVNGFNENNIEYRITDEIEILFLNWNTYRKNALALANKEAKHYEGKAISWGGRGEVVPV
jgi:hypothetical protein